MLRIALFRLSWTASMALVGDLVMRFNKVRVAPRRVKMFRGA